MSNSSSISESVTSKETEWLLYGTWGLGAWVLRAVQLLTGLVLQALHDEGSGEQVL